jgi:hypothetical protein
MKKIIFMMTLVVIALVSCEKPEVKEYEYETNPKYGWGYAEFWGDYYAEYMNTNNVLSLSLFTDSLDVDQDGNLIGFGQYLYLEDVFIAPTDTLIPAGVYNVDVSGDPFSIAPGEEYEYDGDKYNGGAMIYYVEKDEAKSKTVFITGGTMTVSISGEKTVVDCNFILENDSILKGRFSNQLPHFDSSEMSEVGRQKVGKSAIKKIRAN